ncbi:hypothetical protein GGG17_05165 [Arsenicicoccus sp. MKL-02]|uniref:Uncharacterized protein n=1 Tax=Arsenicicoccus cauae TaxID=2663847 RepID=A0A6I3IAX1_9MICO|nr:hypothetical protein [Arsenicicoccus cauae]MTB71368.1 hypothetical protein [Arsenicicoccus cauae]
MPHSLVVAFRVLSATVGALAHYLLVILAVCAAWTGAGSVADNVMTGAIGVVAALVLMERSLAHRGARLDVRRVARSTERRTLIAAGIGAVIAYLVAGLDSAITGAALVWLALGLRDHLEAAARKHRIGSQVAAALGVSDGVLAETMWDAGRDGTVTVTVLAALAAGAAFLWIRRKRA